MDLDGRAENMMVIRRNTEKKKDNNKKNDKDTSTTLRQRSFSLPRKKGTAIGGSTRILLSLIGVASLIVAGMMGFVFLGNEGGNRRHVFSRKNSNSKSSSNAVNSNKKDDERDKKEITIKSKQILDSLEALKGIQDIREKFYTRYGGTDEALELKRKGIHTFGNNEVALKHLSQRFLRAAHQKVDFNLSFGGYSVTVGRGNHFSQSYPFVIRRVLNDLVYSIWGIELNVVNAAIGGIPSLPYGFCLRNFFGENADLVSWDYGMNEGTDITALEAYLRYSLTLPKKPMFLMLDVKPFRKKLIQKYVDANAIVDPIAVSKDRLVNPRFLSMEEGKRPEGYKDWDKWGSPKGRPGQSKWHPKYKEHELLGWIIAMHILDGIEVAVKTMMNNSQWNLSLENETEIYAMEQVQLPSPVSKTNSKNAIDSLLLGTSRSNDPLSKWQYNHVSCRTSFLPVVDGKLKSIVVSGMAPDDGNAMSSKDDKTYQTGWTMDIGKLERDTKRKVEKVGGMGYIDMKLALYGIPESGTLRMWLPYEGMEHDHKHDDDDMLADHWFRTLMFCEVNEKRKSKFHECMPKDDLTFTVGGVKAQNINQITSAASYLGKNLCIQVEIPAQAKITKCSELQTHDNKPLLPDVVEALGCAEDDRVGLTVDIQVSKSEVSRKGGACSISHVIWEQLK